MSESPQRIDVRRRRILRGLGALSATSLLAGCDWTHSQSVQDALSETQWLTQDAMRLVGARNAMAPEYPKSAIAADFKPNGTIQPQNAMYQQLLANNFAGYKLAVHGEVEQPQQFSLAQLKQMPSRSQITRMDCVEGWSCIGGFTGVPLAFVLGLVRPTARAKYAVFHCADYLYNAPQPYYESLDLVEARHPQTLLAYGLNGQALPVENGAPIRLRAARHLGYKNAKYVMAIELVPSFAHIQGGKGGFWEDRGYNWWTGI